MSRFSKLELGDSNEAPLKPAAAPLNPLARAEDDVSAHGLLERARQAFFHEQHAEALRLYGRALAEDDSLMDAWAGQVEALIAMKQLRESDVWVNRALERFPNDVTLLSLRAVIQAHQGMAQRALGTSDFALQQGDSLRAWIARGEVLLVGGNSNANFCLDKALDEASSTDWMSMARVGLAHAANRQPTKALKAFRRALDANPEHDRLWAQVARCHLRLGQSEKALEAAQRALELRPATTLYEDLIREATGLNPIARLFRWLKRG